MIQINYLIEESEHVGKGADTVISLVHNYFELHSLGEKSLIIHADNCSGQNKNNAMIQYLAWRVMTKKHERIRYSFMVPGHTKFSPDGFFGLIKLKYRKSEVDDLEDLVKVVETSTKGSNIAQTIFDVNGEKKVSFNCWTEYLKNIFKPLPYILNYHHFIFDKDYPGFVHAKKQNDDNEFVSIDLIKNHDIDMGQLFLNEKIPMGLSAERQWYLYEHIRQYVQNLEKRDKYCSYPNVPKPRTKNKQ